MVASGYLPGEPRTRALDAQRRLALAAVLGGIFLGSPVDRVSATEARAYMSVTATVVDTVAIRTVYQTQRLVLTARDIERGYVEVAAGSRLELQHKGPYLFEFRFLGEMFRAVKVSGLAGGAEFGTEGGTVLQMAAGTGATSVTMSYRFQLATGIRAGAYPWPLLLTVLPM